MFYHWGFSWFQTTQFKLEPIILIHRMGNFVYHHWGCALIYRPLYYPFKTPALYLNKRILRVVKILNKDGNLKKTGHNKIKRQTNKHIEHNHKIAEIIIVLYSS